MSYSIDEGLEDAQKRARALKKVKELYPDAHISTLPDGEEAWFSEGVEPKDFCFVQDKACLYVEIDGVRVFTRRTNAFSVDAFVDLLSRKHRPLYKALVDELRYASPFSR